MTDTGPGRAQNQVVILRAVIFAAKPQRKEQFPLHHKQMADIVICQQIVRVEVRLDIRFEEMPRRFIAFVFIGINDLRLPPHQHFRHFTARVRR